MPWAGLADLLVAIHFGFAAFVVCGGFLAWRWPRLAWVHVPALLWGTWIEASHGICPLTPLENRLRSLGGGAGYSGDFLAHYLAPLLYPAGLTPAIQWVLAGAVVLVNLIAYAGYLRRHKTVLP